jgi:hypothetical protein
MGAAGSGRHDEPRSFAARALCRRVSAGATGSTPPDARSGRLRVEAHSKGARNLEHSIKRGQIPIFLIKRETFSSMSAQFDRLPKCFCAAFAYAQPTPSGRTQELLKREQKVIVARGHPSLPIARLIPSNFPIFLSMARSTPLDSRFQTFRPIFSIPSGL